MSRTFIRSGAVLASAAALAMAATPAMARDWGWGGGNWGHRHHDRVDAGDIFAGILIIGGIAAIASAASKSSKNSKNSRTRTEPPYPEDRAYRGGETGGGYAGDSRPEWNERSGINSAINRCMDEIDRGKTRVESVDSVARDGEGWRVQGRADGSGSFTCVIDGEGRIREISINGRAA
ncbi:MAG: hypothetical protein ABL926_03385 [Novosphingobium sp.]|uniref:hypothetical protein n=1 Tax=Novosphingobium sp. TaxID=1874826 RepID=UPI0032B7F742